MIVMLDVPARKLNRTFILEQRERILERLKKYNDPEKIKEQSSELQGEITPYQFYKLNVVSKKLLEALKLIEETPEQYGVCLDCSQDIPLERLKKVPGALRCTHCQTKKDQK